LYIQIYMFLITGGSNLPHAQIHTHFPGHSSPCVPVTENDMYAFKSTIYELLYSNIFGAVSEVINNVV
jgi:hypothetical protein